MMNRKAQIIELAMKYFQEKGYLSFSYDDLAKDLSVTKASIHYHFERKEDLGLSVCAKIQDGLGISFHEIKEMDINLEDKPVQFFIRRIRKIGPAGICPLSALQADYNFLPASIQEQVSIISDLEIYYLKQLLEEMKLNGKLREDADLYELAVFLLAGFKGGLQYKRVLGDEITTYISRQARQLLALQK